MESGKVEAAGILKSPELKPLGVPPDLGRKLAERSTRKGPLGPRQTGRVERGCAEGYGVGSRALVSLQFNFSLTTVPRTGCRSGLDVSSMDRVGLKSIGCSESVFSAQLTLRANSPPSEDTCTSPPTVRFGGEAAVGYQGQSAVPVPHGL